MFENIKEFFVNNKLIIGVVTIVTILAIFVYAIFFNNQGTTNTFFAPTPPVKLTFWSVYYGEDYYGDIIKEFENLPQNKDVKVEVILKPYGPSYKNDLIKNFALDVGPDIFSMRNDELIDYLDFVAPINNVKNETGKYIPDSQLLQNYKDIFVDLVNKETIYKDKIYGVTNFVENMQLYFNKDLLNQAEITTPPQTWTGLNKMLSRLNQRTSDGVNFKQSAISLGTGFTNSKNDLNGDVGLNINRFADILPLLVFQNGGQFFDRDTNQNLWSGQSGNNSITKKLNGDNLDNSNQNQNQNQNQDPILDAVKFYESYGNLNSANYSWNANSENNIDSFVQGKLAFLVHYSYLQGIIKDKNPNLNYDISPLPQLDAARKKTYGFFFMQSLSKKMMDQCVSQPNSLELQRKCDKAKEFLIFLTTKSAQEKFALKSSLPSASREIIEIQKVGERKLRTFANGAIWADNYFKPQGSKTEKIWGDIIYRNQLENMPLEQSLAVGQKEYADQISALNLR